MSLKIFLLLCLFFLPLAIWAQEPPVCIQSAIPNQAKGEVNVWPDTLPAQDYLDLALKCAYGPYARFEAPDSAWIDSEREIYSAALSKTPVDVLVVPFQSQGYGFDRIARALMTADLAYSLDDNLTIAEPSLVSHALGEGARRLDREKVVALASDLGAHTVISGFVGHDLEQAMTITIEVMTLDPGRSGNVIDLRKQDWRSVPFSYAEPPSLVFHRMLPQLLQELELPASNGRPLASPQFPEQLSVESIGLTGESSGAVGASVALSLLGALAPSWDEGSREALFVKALMTSWHFDASGPEADFLRAYALLGLNRRPAALAAIDGAPGEHVAALRALANGNLPDASAHTARTQNRYLRLLLAIQVEDLRLTYGETPGPFRNIVDELFGTSTRFWMLLASSRFGDLNVWDVESAGDVGRTVNFVIGMDGADETILFSEEVSLDNAIGREIRSYVESHAPPRCCTSAGVDIEWDLVRLLQGNGETRIAKHLNALYRVESKIFETTTAFTRYRSFFDGHPMIEAAYADFAVRMSLDAPDDEQDEWADRSVPAAVTAAYHMHGQGRISYRALLALGIPSGRSSTFVDAYGFDFPRRAFWPTWFYGEQDLADLRTSLWLQANEHTQSDLTALSLLSNVDSPPVKSALATAIETRFNGHPDRPRFLMALQRESPASAPSLEQLQSAIAANPLDWDGYVSLGHALMSRMGLYDQAVDVFMAYPPFNGTPSQRVVRIADSALDAADRLFWYGRPDLAEPFFEIAVRSGTGSDSRSASKARLNIARGDYVAAAGNSLARAYRFPGASSYRDWLSWLHGYGFGGVAWVGFWDHADDFDNARVWESALVGQRIESVTGENFREWLVHRKVTGTSRRNRQFAQAFAILSHTTDRMPPQDLGELIDEIEGEPVARIGEDGVSLRRPHSVVATGIEYVQPSALRSPQTPRLPEGTPVRSEFALFGAAYAALRHGNSEQAVDRFGEMANHYRVEREHRYALPYFAIAASRTGDVIDLEAFVENLPWSTDSDFYYLLAKAFFAGSRKDADAAFVLLRRAFFARPDPEYPAYRPMLTEYQYADAAEWLYNETGDARFRDELLSWVRAMQNTQPFQSWAYAMEYSHAQTDEQRLRALGMTLYLDPLSDRISSSTAAERDSARAWGKANNPFLLLNRASRFALDGEEGEVGNMLLLLLFGAGSAVLLVPAYVALHPWFTLIVIVAAIALLTYLGVPARLLRRIRGFPSVHDVLVEPGDLDMARSIERSMSEFSRFEEGLADESKQAFVKFRVEIDAGKVEHIWGFAHAIAREFVTVSLEEEEEEFDVPVAEVEDWLLIDEQGRREGGYTHLALARIYRKRYGTVPKDFLRELESFVDIRPTEYAQL